MRIEKVDTEVLKQEIAFRERVEKATPFEKDLFELAQKVGKRTKFQDFLRSYDDIYEKNHGE